MIYFQNLPCKWILLCILSLCCEQMFTLGSSESSHYRDHLSRRVSRMWSEWSLWSTCSRTCGDGVRHRKRVCRERVFGQDGNCSGESIEYELCSRQVCPPTTAEYLDYQCSQHNGLTILGKKISEWIPYRYGPNPCELQCWVKDLSLVYSFGKVIDGTHCPASDPRDPSICVNGRCMAVDCRGRLGSVNKRDICGVCRGDDSTCVKIQNTFLGMKRQKLGNAGRKDHQFEYNEIWRIPAGATGIAVSESSNANFLVLVDYKGNYLLNGNRRVHSPGRFLVDGSEFMYNRTTDGNERLSSYGPTKHELMLMVLGSGDIPKVRYEYWISSKSHTTRSHNYHSPNTVELLESRHAPISQVSRPLDNSISNISYQPQSLSAPKYKGFKSYYHRNEILKSVPSWSIKRRKTFKQPFGSVFGRDTGYGKGHNETRTQQQHFEIRPNTTKQSLILTTENSRNVQQHLKFQHFNIPKNPTVSTLLLTTGSSRYVQQRFSGFERPNGTSAFRRHSRFEDNKLRKTTSKRKHVDTSESARKQHGQQSKIKRVESSRIKRRKSDNGECLPCIRIKSQTKNFCKSDFVLRGTIVASEKEHGTVRLELEVVRSYKNKVPILSREYIWRSDMCECPKIRIGREYILMGRSGNVGRESRLFLDRDSFVRQYLQKRERTMLKLIRNQHSVCRKFDT